MLQVISKHALQSCALVCMRCCHLHWCCQYQAAWALQCCSRLLSCAYLLLSAMCCFLQETSAWMWAAA
jgi:hypothetical protein